MNRINIIRWQRTWRLVIAGRQRAYKVIYDNWWGYGDGENGKKLALWEAKQEALIWAIHHMPADVIIHKDDGTVADVIEMRSRR